MKYAYLEGNQVIINDDQDCDEKKEKLFLTREDYEHYVEKHCDSQENT